MEFNILVSIHAGKINITNYLNESLKVEMKNGEKFLFKFTGYTLSHFKEYSILLLNGNDDEGMFRSLPVDEIEWLSL